jgi:hypothetical protein
MKSAWCDKARVYYLVSEGVVSAADADTASSWGPGQADLIDGLTTVPTWMQVFLKSVLQDDQHAPANPAADDDHDDDDDGHHRRRRHSAPSHQQDRTANQSRLKAAISSRPPSGSRATRRTPKA